MLVSRNNPVAIYYGRGQTERYPSGYPNDDAGGALRRLRFVSAAQGPQEAFDGAILGNIFVPQAEVSADIDAGDNLDDYTVFGGGRLPAGRYNIRVWVGGDIRTDIHFHFSIRRVRAGDDDVELAVSPGYGSIITSGEDVTVDAYMASRNLVVDGTEQFYLCLAGVAQVAGTQGDTRHYMEIERVD